ncbi:MAG TPA: penicillin acylase family protein [Gemmatimonadales bacterium]|nr:penicillin acylase family protein [Gemmatimonadales bacterium]
MRAFRARTGALLLASGMLLVPAAAEAQGARGTAPSIAQQVEIRRTEYGVPHITAANLKAAYYALGYVQLEDHGPKVAMGLLRARGEMGRWFGPDSMDSDFLASIAYGVGVENYTRLDQETRDAYEGFAIGVNRYIEMHPEKFPEGFSPQFTGYDVAARDVNLVRVNEARQFLMRMRRANGESTTTEGEGDAAEGDYVTGGEGMDIGSRPKPMVGADPIEEGSNAWAFAPSRTRSGRAVLVRNPHLSWTAGYYEAHMKVPGVLEFYGDFRIGGPFGVIGGFNRYLGFATTNNWTDLNEIYSLDVDSTRADHYLFDGASVPMERQLVTVTFRNGPGFSTETREMWRTALGPVILREGGKVYVLRGANDGEYRAGEQFLHMMRAESLAQWKEAMRMRARLNSNFTYADRDGNILYVWNAAVPDLPHASGGDTLAIPARTTADIWTRFVPFDSLPQLLNPRGGYVRNENDSPHFTNMNQVMDDAKFPDNFPEPSLRLRSQLSLQLIDNRQRYTLEQIMDLKNSYRMLLADRVKDDLLTAVRAGNPDATTSRAADMLAAWDNTAAHESRGGVLFETWWRKYTEGESPDSMFAHPWNIDEPITTPRGLKDGARAAEAFKWAVAETANRYGSFDVPWGEVHRVRMGDTDVPVGGCGGALGCFRVLNFRTDDDGKRSVIGGDGWVIGVEFGRDVPRGYSVLGYGQSAIPGHEYFGDQAAMFAAGKYKKILWTDSDVEAGTVVRYRPGVDR